tara:strand:+ start:82 stop:393 length:312 start_codon:yes stop_codon:yes gene_type:complete
MTNQEKLEVIEEAFNYYHDRNSLTSEDEKELVTLVDEIKAAISVTRCCTELNNSLKECDDVWFNYEKYKIIGIDYKNKVASIKSVDGLKFSYNLPLDQLTKTV